MALAGRWVVHGFGGLIEGALDDPDVRARALARAAERGYSDQGGAQR